MTEAPPSSPPEVDATVDPVEAASPVSKTTVASGSAGDDLFPDLPEDRKGINEFLPRLIPSIANITARGISALTESQLTESLPFSLDQYSFESAQDEDFRFCDYLEFVVAGGEKELSNGHIVLIDRLSTALRKQAPFKSQHCPFAVQTESQLDFYNKYPEIADVCGFLKCPIIETHEADFFVLTSINPYTVKFAAALISKIITRQTNITPYAFLTTCEKRPWDYLCSKHFGYES